MADHHQRVILHVDLDCFYAQVEHLRLGVPLTQPLAVQQWNNLIAVNYAARAFGVRRHASIQEALGLCPQLRLVHVPTYALQPSTKGAATNMDTDMDTEAFVVDGMAVQPRYHDEEVASFGADGRRMAPAAPDPAAHKACLDPYRQASRAIFALLRAWQPGGAVPVVEKGGLDEAFLDVTEAVEELLVEEYAERYAMLREEVAEQDGASVSVSVNGASASGRGTSYSESSGSSESGASSGPSEFSASSGPSESSASSGPSESSASSGPSESHTPHTPHTSHTSALALYDLTWIETGLCWEGRGGFVLPDAPESSALPLLERSRHALATLRLWRGAALAAQLRQHLRAQLGFQASVGIACNKMLAKLASAMYKPDQQTTVLPGHVRAFMQRVPFDRIRLLGGKLGRRVLHARARDQGEDADEPDGPEDSDEEPAAPGVVHAADLWPLSVEALAERIHGDRQTATWVHQLIRGIDAAPCVPRALARSFMAAKAFRPWLRGWEQLHDWCVVLAGELWARATEERATSGRWPGTLCATWSTGTRPPSDHRASCAFPPYMGPVATPPVLLEALCRAITAEGARPPGLFPMARLALSAGSLAAIGAGAPGKATRVDHFFKRAADGSPGAPLLPPSKASLFSPLPAPLPRPRKARAPRAPATTDLARFFQSTTTATSTLTSINVSTTTTPTTSTTSTTPPHRCTKCRMFTCSAANLRAIQEHADYHVALELARTPGA